MKKKENYTKHRKNINTILEIRTREGSNVRTFKEIAEEGVKYVRSIFQKQTWKEY